MFNKMKSWLTGKQPDLVTTPAPEIMGLHLGGSFEIDKLKLSLLQPNLMIEKAAHCHLIQAVGEVKLDASSTIYRFYTDDDAFLQVVTDGGDQEHHVTDVKLWYFYETRSVGSEQQWQDTLKNHISRPEYSLDNTVYQRVWQGVDDNSPPVAMTEKTWQGDGNTSETDQFVMLYERPIENQEFESLMVSGEETINRHQAKEHCMVLSTGFSLMPADIQING